MLKRMSYYAQIPAEMLENWQVLCLCYGIGGSKLVLFHLGSECEIHGHSLFHKLSDFILCDRLIIRTIQISELTIIWHVWHFLGLGCGNSFTLIKLEHRLEHCAYLIQFLLWLESHVHTFEEILRCGHELFIVVSVLVDTFEGELKREHVYQKNAEGPHVDLGEIVREWWRISLLRCHELNCAREPSFENVGTFC